jgi:hypothetical protein
MRHFIMAFRGKSNIIEEQTVIVAEMNLGQIRGAERQPKTVRVYAQAEPPRAHLDAIRIRHHPRRCSHP